MIQPTHCRAEAFELFCEQLPTLDRNESLLRAAIAVSMHAWEDVRTDDAEDYLRALASRVLSRVRNPSVDALLAHLHKVMFEEEGFAGNDDEEEYYHPRNSYVPAVLALKRGLPITLTLIYKIVGEQVGLRIEGVNAPAHFLARVATDQGWLLIDPFARGKSLSREEAVNRIEQIVGRRIPNAREYLAPATHAQWLARMLNNLEGSLAAKECYSDLAAMQELHRALERWT